LEVERVEHFRKMESKDREGAMGALFHRRYEAFSLAAGAAGQQEAPKSTD